MAGTGMLSSVRFGCERGPTRASLLFALGMLLPTQLAKAETSEDTPVADRMADWMPEVHGFVSQGFMKSTDNNFLAQSERGSFEFNEVGLNFTKTLTDRFRVGMQLFMRDLGPVGNYKPQFDWFYLDYRFFDWLGIRAGRTKIPFGLYNEYNDIDAARVAILLPQSVYPTQNRDYLLAQTGGEIYGRTPHSPVGELEYRAYGGTIFMDTSSNASIRNLDVPYVVGGRLMWETALDGLRLGGTYQTLKLNADLELPPEAIEQYAAAGLLPPDATSPIPFELPIWLWVASLEYTWRELTVAAEYSQWKAKLTTDYPALNDSVRNERMYVMATYQVAPWLATGLYYSLYFPDMDDRTGIDKQQHDVAVSLRFDPIEHWLIKAEGHFMSGTAYLSADLNGGVPPADLTRDWLYFLLKTTAYF